MKAGMKKKGRERKNEKKGGLGEKKDDLVK